MKKLLIVPLATVASFVAAAGLAVAATTVVTPDAPAGWSEVNVRGDGASVISDENPDAHGGNGALRQSFSDAAGKTDFRLVQDFGAVSDLSALSFDWYRDSASSAPGHLTPAVGVYVSDAAGQNSWLLKWEGVYNGYPSNGPAAPVDAWIAEDLLDANFWRIPQVVNGSWVGFGGCNQAGDPFGCFQFDRQLDDAWLDGFGVVGIEVGIGSGWNGSYISFADHVLINDQLFDFETEQGPVDVILTEKAECYDGGWATSTAPEFKNQGQCVSYFQANERAGKTT